MAGRRLLFVLAAFVALTAAPALAACDDDAWNAGAVSARLVAATPLVAGGPLARDATAFTLALAPQADVAFTLPPERAPRASAPQAAVVEFGPGDAGTYRVALSAKAWIDVVQDGRHVPDMAFADFTGCPGLRKMVAFDIGAGAFTLQLSDAEATEIAVAVMPAP